MPKVVIDATKGLHQKSGEGLEIPNSVEKISDLTTRTLSPTKLITILSASVDEVGVTLPGSAQTGALKYIFVDNVDNTTTLSGSNTHVGSNMVFDAEGDGAICRFDGNLWSVLRSNQ